MSDWTAIRTYLGLDENSQPDPQACPIEFLAVHIRHLPPHLLSRFSANTTPKDRARIPAIRNRRLTYTNTNPPELQFSAARRKWPLLNYEGQARRGEQLQDGAEEEQWANTEFLQGSTKHVRKLGTLLAGYEEEREGERLRALRREKAEAEFVPEEEEESDSDEDNLNHTVADEPVTELEAKASFERLIREHFIYGLLEDIDYQNVDWDETLDGNTDRESEEKWFDEEEEGEG